MKTEKAYKLLPHIVKIYKKLDIEELKKKIKSKDVEKAGLDAVAYILENSPKFEKEFFALLSAYEEIPENEVRERPFGETMKSLNEIFTDIEAMSFFKSAMQ